jgi:hypothetical protein
MFGFFLACNQGLIVSLGVTYQQTNELLHSKGYQTPNIKIGNAANRGIFTLRENKEE